jgi:hypothetical protein
VNTTKHEKSIKELFVGECWSYLRKNFRKFSQTNKIKIALELCKKDAQAALPPIIVNPLPSVKINGKDMEVDIG